MPVWVELRRADSTPVRAIEDPSGGKFDAAGDFDRFLGQRALAVLAGIDPYGDTLLQPSDMTKFLGDITTALTDAKDGPEARGLLRLRVLAQLCRDQASSHLFFVGD